MNLARFAIRPLETLRAWHARYGDVFTVKLERDLAYARSLVAQANDVVVGLEERLAQLDN